MMAALTINSINALDNKTKDDSSSSKDSKSKSNKNDASSKPLEDNNAESSGKTDGGKSSTPKQQQTPSSNKNNIKQSSTPPSTPNNQQNNAITSILSSNLATNAHITKPPAFLLLLDSKQICLLANNFQCVTLQNLFSTSSLMTTFDSVNSVWALSGSVKDVSKFQLNNVKVTAAFNDSRGNIIGLPVISNVNPGNLNPFEDGTFSFQASIKDMKGGNPIFVELIYSISS